MQSRPIQSFNSQLLAEESASENIVLDSQKSYSNRFHSSGGNAAYSVMANTLRGIYGIGCADRNRKQLYGKRAESWIYRKNGRRHDHAKQSVRLTAAR